MEEQLISFDVAKLAKEKGFDVPVFRYYHDACKGKALHDNGSINAINLIGCDYNAGDYNKKFKRIKNLQFYSAPSQNLLQKWLREVHKIHFGVNPYGDTIHWDLAFMSYTNKKTTMGRLIYTGMRGSHLGVYNPVFNVKYKSYEDAVEAGLKEALKVIKLN